MSLGIMSLILLGILVFLLFIGTEVFVAVGITAAIGLVFFVGQPLGQFPYTAFHLINSFVLTAVPLFIFMGAIFSATGIVHRLFDAGDKWFGSLPGGIASSVIGVNAIFGAMCGSIVAATATFGKIAFPEMERLGYNPRFSLGTLAVGGMLSAAIPPSLTLVVYGAWANVSVPRLFAGVLIPGLLLTLLLMITVMVRAKLNPSLAPESRRFTWGEKLIALRDLAPWLAVILLILGVIYGGFMTVTEAAALGAFLSVVLALAYRRMTFAAFNESIGTAIKITAMVAFLFFSARVLGQVFQYIGLTDLFSDFLIGLPFGRYAILAIIWLMYVVLEMFIEDWSILLLSIPFVLPVVIALGFSPLWFGVFYVMVGGIGWISPPFGLSLFVLSSVVPEKYDAITIALGALPFMIPLVLMAVLLAAFPDLATWLPSVLFSH